LLFSIAELDLRSKVDCFSTGVGSIDSWADIDARSATRTILGRNLHGDFETRNILAFSVDALEGRRRIFKDFRIISFHADYAMRAD